MYLRGFMNLLVKIILEVLAFFFRLCTITILPGLFNHLHDLRCANTAFENTMYK